MDRGAQLLIILVIEAAVGYPQAVYRIVRHPIVWLGALISAYESRRNKGSARRRRIAGCTLFVMLLVVAVVNRSQHWYERGASKSTSVSSNGA